MSVLSAPTLKHPFLGVLLDKKKKLIKEKIIISVYWHRVRDSVGFSNGLSHLILKQPQETVLPASHFLDEKIGSLKS